MPFEFSCVDHCNAFFISHSQGQHQKKSVTPFSNISHLYLLITELPLRSSSCSVMLLMVWLQIIYLTCFQFICPTDFSGHQTDVSLKFPKLSLNLAIEHSVFMHLKPRTARLLIRGLHKHHLIYFCVNIYVCVLSVCIHAVTFSLIVFTTL